MFDRGSRFGLVARVGPPLAVAAAAGFLLGSCGGGEGGALTTATGVTVTRPAVTATRPPLTATRPPVTPTGEPSTQTVEVEETTVEVTTTEPSATFTVETTLETTVETQTTVSVTITPPTATAETTVATTEEESSANDTPWGWIALGVLIAGALLLAFALWRRQRNRAATWSSRLGDLARRTLVALDDVMARGSVVTGQIEALAAEARSLETRAPDDQARGSAARLRARLDELANTLESDRALRLSSPPPSQDQLAYSTALIRQQAEQLRGVLRTPSDQPPPDGP